ncbi:TRAP transporter small permease [Mesobacterium pallidum]|uniref:TRAP transporter small permease n=1 Tax=Mesobacterium pallidum TaxID=2872037 RepID=UPI001EE1CB67|nr:TRAP transporter small permease [Mesobacterium pallidum]
MSIALVALMGVVTCDVIGRNLFDHPLIWAGEIVEILVALSVVLGFPLLALHGRHITVAILPVNGAAERIIGLFGAVLSAAMFALVSYVLFKHGGDLKSWGENTMIMRLPLWIFALALGVLFGLSAIAFLIPGRWVTTDLPDSEV